MQRRSVDLPDPDGPMMQTTSPLRTSNVMPFSTSIAAERLADVGERNDRLVWRPAASAWARPCQLRTACLRSR